MKRIWPRLLLLIAIMCLAVASSVSATGEWRAKTDQALLTATSAGREAEFLVLLREQADLSTAASLSTKAAKGRYVYQTLTATAAQSQASLRTMLDANGASYRAYWVTNMIWVRGDRALVQALASRPEVEYLYANTWQRIQLPEVDHAPTPRQADLIEWNISIVRAPAVWAEGFTGQGAVVGGQDTGYDWTHPAIRDQYRGWDGSAADHNYNWHDAIHGNNPATPPGNPCGFDSPKPCDDDGHGTHTMGTMVGRAPNPGSGFGSEIGMAPDAKWIGCRNMEEGWGSPATYTECFEWFIAPYPLGADPFTAGDPERAPDVINNSWSCPQAEGCSASGILRQVVENVRAAGILTVQSAGNSGPSCSSVREPAAIYDASFTVGATDSQNEIAFFSSRGPVTRDGSGRLKPDVSAPGVGVLSSVPGGGYAWLSGTSMAAPHVSGLVALLISAKPALSGQPDTLEAAMTNTALRLTTNQRCGSDTSETIPNNVYGWGRIDALAAYENLDSLTAFYNFAPVLLRGSRP